MSALFDLGYPATEYKSERPGYRGTNLQSFHSRFPDKNACLRHLFHTRFGENPHCPKCRKPGQWYPIGGTRQMQHPCGYAKFPSTGTIFERSNIPLQIWFYAMLHFANSTYGVTTPFLARHLGLTHKAAYRLADRIRMHMAGIDAERCIGQPDELYEVRIEFLAGVRTTRYPTRGSARAVLLGDHTGVQATLIGKPRRHILRSIMADKTIPGARAVTTCKYTHAILSEYDTRRPCAELVAEFKPPELAGVNPINSFLNYFRRPMRSTHRRVDYENLWKYLKEFEFRFNRRPRSHETFLDLISHFPDLSPARCDELQSWSLRSDPLGKST